MGMVTSILIAAAAASGRTAADQDLRQAGADLTTELLMALPNNRGREAEADRVGIELASRAGFDPRAAASVWEKMLKHGATSNSRFDWMNTHPATPKRIEALTALTASLMPVYLAARPAVTDNPSVRMASIAAAPTSSTPVRPVGPTPAMAMSLTDMCNMPSMVDRAECLGILKMGMTRAEVTRELGQPQESDGTVARYSDRYLQFDTQGRLVGITDRRPAQ
jgi:hypothetical protein